jgi:hypothetical protein
MNGSSAIQKVMARIGFELEVSQSERLWVECADQLKTKSGKKLSRILKRAPINRLIHLRERC